MSARRTILAAATRERLTYDLGPLRAPVAWTVWVAARVLLAAPSPRLRARVFGPLMRLHSGAFSPAVDRRIIDVVRDAAAGERHGRDTGLSALYDEQVRVAVAAFRAGTKADPKRLIGSRILVVKSWKAGERGVLVVDYSYVFPLLAGLFDLPRIADRYTVVLEPSWAGACTPEILLYSRLPHLVFVQTIEPRDRDLLTGLHTNLEVVPIAANWWVDHRQAPVLGTPRDIDVIMVATWADIKRHWRVFRVLAGLRARGHRLRVALVGYRYDRTKADIEGLADYFGIRDQIETYERIPQEEVSRLLARSKVHILWSRRECANRAIIEAMLADVPVIVREGLTFGFRYPYINEHTGRFVAEADLGSAILEMMATRERYAPREWILANMTAGKAIATLEARLREQALASGDAWTEGLVVKTSTLDTQRYWNPDDRSRFAADYAFLESAMLPSAEPKTLVTISSPNR
jgi:glycosyltransferase involved in cell wall biosynthesis